MIYNFKAKTSNLKYPLFDDYVINCSDKEYNLFMIFNTLKKLSEIKSVTEFNDVFDKNEDVSVPWEDFNLEFYKNPNPDETLFAVNTNGVHKYNINDLTGNLENI